MRLDLEHTHATFNEFIERLRTLHEPVELTRKGKVVATVVPSLKTIKSEHVKKEFAEHKN